MPRILQAAPTTATPTTGGPRSLTTPGLMPPAPKVTAQPGYIDQVAEQQGQGFAKIGGSITKGASDIQKSMDTTQAPLPRVGNALKGIAEAGFGTITGAAQVATSAVTPAISKLISAVTPVVRSLNPVLAKAYDAIIPKVKDLATKHPDAATLIGDIVNTLLLAVGGGAAEAPAKEAIGGAFTKDALGGLKSDITGSLKEGATAVKNLPGNIADTKAASEFTGKMAQKDMTSFLTNAPTKEGKTAIENVTPKTKDLTFTEYEDLLGKKKITPKTATSPSTYILSDSEKATAQKYSNLLQNKDPVKNSINLMNEIASKDSQVGDFLAKNNTKIDPVKMKTFLADKLKDVTDIMVDTARLNANKTKMINNFVDGLTEKDVKNAWINRKAFDQQIENAFKGSPSLIKDMKRGLRNAVQDYIAELTPDGVYKGYMKDMTQLFDLEDVVATKANKEKGMNALQVWAKNNPTKAKLIGIGITASGYEGLKHTVAPFLPGI